MYSVENNVAIINGASGKYDKILPNEDVRYGRNAFDNFKSYAKDLKKPDDSVPLKYEYRYMPDGQFNKFALLGNAYEELGRRTKVKTEKLNKKFNKLNKELEKQGLDKLSANALDINKDGYIDVSEYATSTLSQDIMSTSGGAGFAPNMANGVITNEGEEKALGMNDEKYEEEARQVFTKLHEDFELGKAQEEFLADKKNLKKTRGSYITDLFRS